MKIKKVHKTYPEVDKKVYREIYLTDRQEI